MKEGEKESKNDRGYNGEGKRNKNNKRMDGWKKDKKGKGVRQRKKWREKEKSKWKYKPKRKKRKIQDEKEEEEKGQNNGWKKEMSRKKDENRLCAEPKICAFVWPVFGS